MVQQRFMWGPALAIISLMAAGPVSAAKEEARSQPPPQEEIIEEIGVGVLDILTRLKLLRVQMALDREEIAALSLRLEKLRLQKEFEAVISAGGDDGTKRPTRRRRSTFNAGGEIIVKAISLKPSKEAIVLFRGRTYTVRPGDVLGPYKIKNITQNGLGISSTQSSGRAAVVR
jgi:hypothetical protein